MTLSKEEKISCSSTEVAAVGFEGTLEHLIQAIKAGRV